MKVVIIGGGIGGLASAKGLRKKDKNVEIIIVEPKQFMEVHWAAYRSPFDENIAKGSLFELKDWAAQHSIKLIHSKVTALTEKNATLVNGDVLEFDICVVAVGAAAKWEAIGRGPIGKENKTTIEDRLGELKAEGEKLLNAGSVAVVGGGLIGVEVAGDLASYAKQKQKTLKVTLINSGEQLCDREFTKKASVMAERKLKNLGVTVVLNDRATKDEATGKVTLEKSKTEIDAKEIIYTTGFYSIHQSFMDAKYLDEDGWVNVDDYFRVEGAKDSIMAIGDCCNVLPNSAAQLMGNLDNIGHNLKALLDAKEKGDTAGVEKKMRKALLGAQVYCATIGNSTGVAQTPWGHTQLMLPWLKNSTMFFMKIKQDLGVKN